MIDPRETPPHAEPITGACLCGAVSIRLEGARTGIEACHCTMCRAWGGGPFLSVSARTYHIEGEEHITAYRSSAWAERAFCKRCGSNLWFEFLPAKHRGFLAGLFELPDSYTLAKQIFTDEKPGFYDFAQQTRMQSSHEVIAEAKMAGYSFD